MEEQIFQIPEWGAKKKSMGPVVEFSATILWDFFTTSTEHGPKMFFKFKLQTH